MKILNPQSALLSNNELYTHLTSKRATAHAASQSRSTRRAKAPAYEAISREILEYLSPGTAATAAGSATTTTDSKGDVKVDAKASKGFPLPDYAKFYSDGNVRGVIRELGRFELVQAEVLGIVNLAPKDLASLDALVEELDARFSEEEQEEILKIVEKWLRR